MKYYKCVLKKVEETNYKKGIVAFDETSSFYRTSKLLYILSFIWFMIFHTAYLLGNTFTVFYPRSMQNVNNILFPTSWAVLVAMIAALVLIKYKKQILTFALTAVGGIGQIVALSLLQDLKNQTIEHSIIATKYFWFHHAPIILMIIFAAAMLYVDISRRRYLRMDYEEALQSMFIKYSEEHPSASDTEWAAHLEELDREIMEKELAEKAEKKEKKRKK